MLKESEDSFSGPFSRQSVFNQSHAMSVSQIQKSVIELEDIANPRNTNLRVDFWSQIEKDEKIEKMAKKMMQPLKMPIDAKLYKELQKKQIEKLELSKYFDGPTFSQKPTTAGTSPKYFKSQFDYELPFKKPFGDQFEIESFFSREMTVIQKLK